MKRFKQGQTVYLIRNNFLDHSTSDYPLVSWVEKYTVTNDPPPPPECIAFYNGKVSRHSLVSIPDHFKWMITRSRRKAERRCRIANQVNLVFQ